MHAGTINRIEEMMCTGANISYSNVTITTDIRHTKGVVSTISTRLDTPVTASPSPGEISCCLKAFNTALVVQIEILSSISSCGILKHERFILIISNLFALLLLNWVQVMSKPGASASSDLAQANGISDLQLSKVFMSAVGD